MHKIRNNFAQHQSRLSKNSICFLKRNAGEFPSIGSKNCVLRRFEAFVRFLRDCTIRQLTTALLAILVSVCVCACVRLMCFLSVSFLF